MTLLELMDAPVIDGTDFVAAVARYFAARPNEWIDANELMAVAGRFGWRTRVSNARKQYGMQIDNRLRRVHSLAGTTYTVSEYRYQPQPSVR